MKRRNFLTGLLGTTLLLSMDGFSTMANAIASENLKKAKTKTPEFASFGAIHMNITNLKQTTEFWTKIVGMKLRKVSDTMAEFGTDSKTLVVVHEKAKTKFQKGYSGLYHVAIHAPNKAAFASMVNRVLQQKYPCSPVDHTMSKSLYLDDPDGINIEFTLETPERFKRVVTDRGIGMEGTDGVIRSAGAQLDLNAVLSELKDSDINKPVHNDTYIGHLHLYANNVKKSDDFYKKLGFIQFNFMPQFKYADVGAGGDYQHRIAMNAWHGDSRPMAPEGSAGMRHFQINLSKEKLDQALINVPNYEEKDGGYWFVDPTGNTVFVKVLEEVKEEKSPVLTAVVREPKGTIEAAPVLMLFHGYGSNEHDLFNLFNSIPENWYIVSVRAPFEIANNQYAWYNGERTNNTISIDVEMEKKSRTNVSEYIEQFIETHNVDPNKIVTAGFSQGAGLALTLLLTHPDKVHAAACFSGRVMDQVKPSIEKHSAAQSKELFIGHGTSDARSPMNIVEDHKKWVESFGVNVSLKTYDMGHSISQEEVAHFTEWLNQL